MILIVHLNFKLSSGLVGLMSCYDNLGCIKLPSQRTLRDYTHYVQSCEGFSADVDVMLRNAVNVESCPEREKYVVILIDECARGSGV